MGIYCPTPFPFPATTIGHYCTLAAHEGHTNLPAVLCSLGLPPAPACTVQAFAALPGVVRLHARLCGAASLLPTVVARQQPLLCLPLVGASLQEAYEQEQRCGAHEAGLALLFFLSTSYSAAQANGDAGPEYIEHSPLFSSFAAQQLSERGELFLLASPEAPTPFRVRCALPPPPATVLLLRKTNKTQVITETACSGAYYHGRSVAGLINWLRTRDIPLLPHRGGAAKLSLPASAALTTTNTCSTYSSESMRKLAKGRLLRVACGVRRLKPMPHAKLQCARQSQSISKSTPFEMFSNNALPFTRLILLKVASSRKAEGQIFEDFF